jgi:hypothetical protein
MTPSLSWAEEKCQGNLSFESRSRVISEREFCAHAGRLTLEGRFDIQPEG